MALDPKVLDLRLPDGFDFGLTTSCIQIEGAADEGGKGRSIWDAFATRDGAIRDGSDPARAIDHYHRLEADLDLLGRIGPSSYRPAIAWSRVDPDGDGRWNQEGIDFYRRLVDGLLERDIDPWVTLYFWDLPQALQDRGGWEARDTALRFQDYVDVMQTALGGGVHRWTTFEEPLCIALFGYGSGMMAPGIARPDSALRAAHHVLLAHGLATETLKSNDQRSEVGIALNMGPVEAASSSAADRDAARRADAIANRFFLEAVLDGAYPREVDELMHQYLEPGVVQDGDMKLISTPIDYLGVNYYKREYAAWTSEPRQRLTHLIGCDDVLLVKSGRPATDYGWEIDHQGLYDLLMRLHFRYPDMPLYVGEAGASFADEVEVDGAVHDQRRIEYLRGQFDAAQRAVRAGVDLRGFSVWTFLDNWEYHMGWSQRFGLVHVDHTTLERRPKDSAFWYRDLIAQHRAG